MACQDTDAVKTPQTSEVTPTQNPTSSSLPTITQTPQPLPTTEKTPSVPSQSETSIHRKKQVAVTQNRSSNQQTCQISAYIIDKDPNGLNVRSEPSNQSKVIDTLPTKTLGVIVDISAVQSDWVQISKAQSPGRLEFQGSGWVYTQLLGTSTRGYGTKNVSVYKSANAQSETIGQIPSQRGVKLLSCYRDWALVEYDGLKGWIEPNAQCANPLTTCP
jgi:SH3-like domain-containing protein